MNTSSRAANRKLPTPPLGLLLTTLLIASASAQTPVGVNWRADRKVNDAQTYQINAWDGINPAAATATPYQAALTDWNPGMIRIHGYEMYSTTNTAKRWIDYSTQSWDAAKIAQVLAALRPKTGEVMLSIPNWPSWMDSNNDGKLDDGGAAGSPDRRDDYAAFCADLVRIANVTNNFQVKYWEPLNEKETSYGWGADANFADIYNRCAIAMKAVDPSIVIGGPAIANPWPSSSQETAIKAWVAAVKPHLGFFSYHYYGTGGYNPSSDNIYNAAALIGARATWARGLLNSQTVSADVPVYIGETHIFSNWTLDQNTAYMRTMFGGNFVSLVIKSVGENPDARAVQFFNDRDNTYGFLRGDSTYARRSASHVLQLANEHLVGTSVGTTTSDAGALQLYAVKSGDKKAVLLVNTSDIALSSGAGLLAGTNHTAAITFSESWVPTHSAYTIYTIAETSADTASLASSNGTYTGGVLNISVPSRQIKLLVFTDVQNPDRLVRSPVADTMAQERNPSVNYGANNRLNVYAKADWNVESFLRFDVSNVGGTIASAKLRLYPRVVNGSATHRLDLVTDNAWSESALTWSNRPAGSGSWLGTWTPVANGIHEIDVTAAAQAASGPLSFRITSTAGADIRYGSREELTEFRPELIILRNATTSYHLYSESGSAFASEGGTVQTYAVSVSTQTSGAPEGSQYLRITDTGHYAGYDFRLPNGDANKSSWADATLVFDVRSVSNGSWEIGLRDALGVQKRFNLSSYITRNGQWEIATVPLSHFTAHGVNLARLQKIFFYHPWVSGQALDLDDILVLDPTP